jgi:hypothetical protein
MENTTLIPDFGDIINNARRIAKKLIESIILCEVKSNIIVRR